MVHLNEHEIVVWHIINLAMMNLGLWSEFKFKEREDFRDFNELLMITALKAKQICNTENEFQIYSETVFHNTSLAYLTS